MAPPPGRGARLADGLAGAASAGGCARGVAAWASGGAAGRRTEIVVPSPIREVAVIVPPWAATISRETNSPRPRPVARCGWRSRVYASKTIDRSSAAMPAPWSRTSTTAKPPDRRTTTSMAPDPAACSTAFASRFRKTCSRRPASPRTISDAGFALKRIVGALARTAETSVAARTIATRSTGSTQDLELAGLDATDVEQPLDEVAQAPRLRQRRGRRRSPPRRCRRWRAVVRRAGGSCGWRPSAS